MAGSLKQGKYEFRAVKDRYPDSPVSELTLTADTDLALNLTLGANCGFLERMAAAYVLDWRAAAASVPTPPRRDLPSPLSSPPFPNSDWSYGASPEIGVPDADAPPVTQALYSGRNGDAWERSRVKVYGWLAGSANASTSRNSNFPVTNQSYPNRFELDQAVIVAERTPDTVQTGHFDWGFHISGLFGTDYRFTTDLGYISGQLTARHRRYGFDPELEYLDIYIPSVGAGLNLRIGRAYTLPGIESQVAPGNYAESHSLLYYASPTTATGIIGTVKMNDHWLFQLGLTAGNDVAPWSADAKLSVSACIGYRFNRGSDYLYPCVNGLNGGRYAFNNVQVFDNTWYHKFNDSWHMATEVLYMYQLGVPGVSGSVTPEPNTFAAVCPSGSIRCRAAEWAVDSYLERQLSKSSYVSFRADYLADAAGQQTGHKDRYSEVTLTWGHWMGSYVLVRPEIRFDHAMDRPAYDEGTRRNQFLAGLGVILKF
jgi:hypothetical protein